MARIGGIFDDSVLNIRLQRNIVATARVVTVFAEIGTIEGMLVFLTLVVFQMMSEYNSFIFSMILLSP
jgi:hypothetical protein